MVGTQSEKEFPLHAGFECAGAQPNLTDRKPPHICDVVVGPPPHHAVRDVRLRGEPFSFRCSAEVLASALNVFQKK